MALSIIGKPITKKLLGYVGGVFALVIVILVIFLSLSRLTIGRMQTEVGALRQSAAQCAEDNEHQTKALGQCIAKRTELVESLAMRIDAATRAELEARTREQQRLRQLDQARARLDRLLETSETCAAWSEMKPCDEIWSDLRDQRRQLIEETRPREP